jgi:hypothetical protein
MTDIMPKLNRAVNNGIDQQFTERTLATVKANDEMGKAACDFVEAVRTGKPQLIEAARRKHLSAVDAYFIATGRDPVEERKRLDAVAAMAAGHEKQPEEANPQEEMSTPEERGIIPKEILEDPEYPKIRQDIQAELLRAASNGQGRVIIPEDEVDKKVVEAFQAIAIKRTDLQKESTAEQSETAA